MTKEWIKNFLDRGCGSFAVGQEVEDLLKERGFKALQLREEWRLESGRGYFIRSGGSVTAFRVGSDEIAEAGMVLMGAHTDSPTLQLKTPSAAIIDGQLVVAVEVYGGPIVATWLDRNLAIAGKVLIRDARGRIRTVSIFSDRPVALIPNLAVHLNRESKEKTQYNFHDQLRALCGPTDPNRTPEEGVFQWLYPFLPAETEAILESEIALFPAEEAIFWGAQESLISSSRLDNLAGTLTVLSALADAPVAPSTQVAFFMDHEEIGSVSAFGASGTLAETTLRRMAAAIPGTHGNQDLERALARSVLISNDGAHARNPNYSDKHDPAYAPILGGGPVIKKSAVRRYTTELEAVGWLSRVASQENIPLQFIQNRADISAGSTIGPALSSRLGVIGLDIGIPMLAMHSIRETANFQDIDMLYRLLKRSYQEDPGML